MASPSTTASRTGSARAHSTTSGTRAVTSCSWRVKTRTSSPARCTWSRAPSSLYSKAASPSRSSASSASPAGFASIGATGDSSRSEKRARPAAPSSSAARATSPMLPANIAACRTLGGGQLGGLRDRLQHEALERALAHLARQQLEQEAAPRVVRALEQRAQAARRDVRPSPRPSRSRARRAPRRGPRASAAPPPAARPASPPARLRQPIPIRPWGSVPVR